MSDWTHGYDVSVGYTYGFFSEMAPNWLDLCVGVAGYVPPRLTNDSPFRYLELGCGQGLGLCVLAAANPQGEFLGIDFHPEHIAHAKALAATAGLTNIRFVEADFADLARVWPADYGQFDYVALHGIYSWVPVAVRHAIVDCLADATRPGSVVYNSYNAQPGWLPMMPFQHMARMIKATSAKSGKAVFEDTITLFDRVRANNGAISKVLPTLAGRIDEVKGKNPNYLIQEYLHESWHPMWHSEVAREFARAKLAFVGSATISEAMLPGRLPQPLQDVIAEQPEGSIRQDLLDIVINQSFRRDIFCRGPRRGNGRMFESTTLLHLLVEPFGEELEDIKTSFGTIKLEPSAYAEIVGALAKGPHTIEQIHQLPISRGRGRMQTSGTLLSLLHKGILGAGAAGPGNVATCNRLNLAIAHGQAMGLPYHHIAASTIGAGIAASDFDLTMITCLDAMSEPVSLATLSKAAVASAAKLGRKILHENKEVTGEAAEKRVADGVKKFLDKRLPLMRRLGAVPADS
jgi:SAM-dependent methyltransferase